MSDRRHAQVGPARGELGAAGRLRLGGRTRAVPKPLSARSRYPAGSVITVPRIIGHTTLGLTACPGGAMIPLIPQIQTAVQKRIKRYAKKRRKKGKKHHKRRSGTLAG